MGDVQATASPQQDPGHPTAIMRLSALAETEGIVYAGCGLRLRHSCLSERKDCLGQPPGPGAVTRHVTTNSEQAKGQPPSRTEYL